MRISCQLRPVILGVGQSAASDNAKPDKLDAERLRFLCDPGNDWIHMGVMIMHQLCEQFIEAFFNAKFSLSRTL